MGLKELLQEEFSFENFLLDYKQPRRFVQTEFGAPRLYALWRLVWMVYHVAAIITSGLLEQFYATSPENRIKWFIFLTNWSFIIVTLATIVDFFSTIFVLWACPAWFEECKEVETLPWYLKTLWVLSNIGNAMSITVTIVYWTSGTFDSSKGLSGHRILPFLGHGMNSIYIVCNLCVTAMPVRLLHCWQPFVFTFIYGIFNLIYGCMGATDDMDHHYIYPPIDWVGDPLKAEILALCVIFGVVLVHVIVFFFQLLRRKIAEACMCHMTSGISLKQCPPEDKKEKDSLTYGSTQELKKS